MLNSGVEERGALSKAFKNQIIPKIGKREFRNASLQKFRLKPAAHETVDLACEVTLTDIADRDISYLCKLVRTEVAVEVETPDDLFNGKGGNHEDEH